jgi:hypothetical protein
MAFHSKDISDFSGADTINISDVCDRIDELREQRTARYVVGQNMPGYMPDNTPDEFDDSDNAREALAEAMEREADEIEPDPELPDGAYDAQEVARLRAVAAELREQAEALRTMTDSEGDYSRQIGNTVYWFKEDGVTGLDDDEAEELTKLEALMSELEGYGGNHKWEGVYYPSVLVNKTYFVTFAEEEAESMGLIQDNVSWPYTCIDWEKAAAELEQDYSSVDFEDSEYLYRA